MNNFWKVFIGVMGSLVAASLVMWGIITLVDTVVRSVNPEAAYINTVHSAVVGSDQADDRDTIHLGLAVCSAQDAGVPRDGMVREFTKNGFTEREANSVIDAANLYLCRDN